MVFLVVQTQEKIYVTTKLLLTAHTLSFLLVHRSPLLFLSNSGKALFIHMCPETRHVWNQDLPLLLTVLGHACQVKLLLNEGDVH